MSFAPIKVFCSFGTRPEAIKMAPLVLLMREQPERFTPIVSVTGQHREMLEQVLVAFNIKPDFDLSVMTPNQTLADVTSRILQRTDNALTRADPDLVLVQGDTTTAFAGGLAAFYRKIPVGHVEAGLRTGDFSNPFPEEANRVFIDCFARFCFAPTENNRRTLLLEGVPAERILVTGNTGIDALRIVRAKVQLQDGGDWRKLFGSAANIVAAKERRLVLITLHRRESFGDTMRNIFHALRAICHRHSAVEFVYPVHLNPNVKSPAEAILGDTANMHLINPLPYEAFVYLMDRASLILTDSGGIQEEAPWLGKPVIVLRETTERQEALESGLVTLGGTNVDKLSVLIENALQRNTPGATRVTSPYGDGQAAGRILNHIWDILRLSQRV